jgi:hypothetical protein
LRQLLTERYRARLAGVLSCYDRIIVTGTLPGACYTKGMRSLGGTEGSNPSPSAKESVFRGGTASPVGRMLTYASAWHFYSVLYSGSAS